MLSRGRLVAHQPRKMFKNKELSHLPNGATLVAQLVAQLVPQIKRSHDQRGESDRCGKCECDQAIEKSEARPLDWFVCWFIGRCDLVIQFWVSGVRAPIVTHI
jgi:hypothetical protein